MRSGLKKLFGSATESKRQIGKVVPLNDTQRPVLGVSQNYYRLEYD